MAEHAFAHRGAGMMKKLAAIDDGQILRAAFFILLVGTAGMLLIDYDELLSSAPAAIPQSADPGLPTILPSVTRPELDPNNPAFTPGEQVTTSDDQLRQPMAIELLEDGVLSLTGTIGIGTLEKFEAELQARGEYVKSVSLNSPGGAVSEALAIGKLIRAHGYATRVANGALCASSCPLLLASGVERSADEKAVIGVHQIYAGFEQDVSASQALSDAQIATARISRYLDEMGIDQTLWLHALETPPDRLYYLTPQECATLSLTTKSTK